LLCYYGSWASLHTNGRCGIEHLDPKLCTHFIYAFVGINQDGTLRNTQSTLNLVEESIKFNKLKLANPKLKTMVAVGGYDEGSASFSIVAKDPAKRKVFVQAWLKFLIDNKFDGLDMDWEYPGQREGSDPAVDKANFVLLLQELKNALVAHYN
jgi:chitinase